MLRVFKSVCLSIVQFVILYIVVILGLSVFDAIKISLTNKRVHNKQ